MSAGPGWVVRRRWRPRQLGNDTWASRLWGRFRAHGRRAADGADVAPDGCLEVFGEGFLVGIGIVVALFVFVFILFPALAITIELVYLLALLIGGVVSRVLFRRPWTIEAIRGAERHEWQVVGWRASRAATRLIAHEVRAGRVPNQQAVNSAIRGQ